MPFDVDKWARQRAMDGKYDAMVSEKLENRHKVLLFRIERTKSKLKEGGLGILDASKLRIELMQLNDDLSSNIKERRDHWWNNFPSSDEEER